MTVRVQTGDFDAGAEIARLRAGNPAVGAVASFIGEAVHQSFSQAVALGLGDKLVASMIEAQEKVNGVRILER